MVPMGVDFVSLSIAIRVVEGLGAASYITASFAITANEFPQKVSTMFVSIPCKKVYLGDQ